MGTRFICTHIMIGVMTLLFMCVLSLHSHAADAMLLNEAASKVESTIRKTMAKSGQSGGPTLQQLGTIQSGATQSEAKGGLGGKTGSSGGG